MLMWPVGLSPAVPNARASLDFLKTPMHAFQNILALDKLPWLPFAKKFLKSSMPGEAETWRESVHVVIQQTQALPLSRHSIEARDLCWHDRGVANCRGAVLCGVDLAAASWLLPSGC